jgi:hypothetical protein
MITREEAWALLTKYNREDFHLQHAQIVEGVMRYFGSPAKPCVFQVYTCSCNGLTRARATS